MAIVRWLFLNEKIEHASLHFFAYFSQFRFANMTYVNYVKFNRLAAVLDFISLISFPFDLPKSFHSIHFQAHFWYNTNWSDCNRISLPDRFQWTNLNGQMQESKKNCPSHSLLAIDVWSMALLSLFCTHSGVLVYFVSFELLK